MTPLAHAARRGLAAPMVLVLVAAGASFGQEGAARSGAEIRDEAKMFGAEAVRQARAVLEHVERDAKVPVVIETIESLEGEPLREVAMRRARRSDGQRMFFLIAREDKEIYGPLVPRELLDRLPEKSRRAIREAFIEQFKKKDFDAGLSRGVAAIAEALTGPGGSASGVAAAAPLVERDRVRLTLAGARRVLAGAEAKAAAMGLKQNIAVVDDGGHLLAFIRMDGGRPASAATAQTKAITAATFRQATGPLPPGTKDPDVHLNLSLQNAAAASGGKLTTLLGGLPILVDNQVIGAVGVGGGTGAQDVEVAKAGIAAFQEGLNPSGTAAQDRQEGSGGPK